MNKKLYLRKGNMDVLKTPVDFNGYTILAVGVNKYGNQLIRAKKGDKQKSFVNNYGYDVNIGDFVNETVLSEFINSKNGKKMLEHMETKFKK